MRVALKPHPASPPRAITGVTAQAHRNGDDLTVSWRAAGDLDLLLLPEQAAPRRADGLWRHTCFELFLRPGAGDRYFEFNFSPSGEWAAYSFDGYRDGMTMAPGPRVQSHRTKFNEGAYHAWASFSLSEFPELSGVDWRMAITAILEERDGTKSYWADYHPPEAPDFHDPAGFTLKLPRAAKS